MIIKIEREGTVGGLAQVIDDLSQRTSVQGLLILACDDNGFTPDNIDPLLKRIALPFFGGVFPQIINGREQMSRGTIVAGLPRTPDVQIITGLSDPSLVFDEVLERQIPVTGEIKTMFVFVDGLASRIGALIDGLFNIFGLEFSYLGGGAGSLSMRRKPCLFTNQGLLQDCATLAMVDIRSGVGVAHGWQPISGPYSVTESDRNVIQTLDWRPAFEIYKEIVERDSGRVFATDNFFDIAKYYPFGISKIDAESIVRDPVMKREDGALVCVGEVPPQAQVDILTADVESLVAAATKALSMGLKSYSGAPEDRVLLFMDCISRVLCLKEDYHLELDAVCNSGLPVIGALTIGEIANSGKSYLEFYNKTAVVGVVEGR